MAGTVGELEHFSGIVRMLDFRTEVSPSRIPTVPDNVFFYSPRLICLHRYLHTNRHTMLKSFLGLKVFEQEKGQNLIVLQTLAHNSENRILFKMCSYHLLSVEIQPTAVTSTPYQVTNYFLKKRENILELTHF